MLSDVASGFLLFFQPMVILGIAGGTILGLILGALPGLTATMGIAIALPIAYGLPPVQGFGVLLGIYCGAIAGGSIAAILVKIPGTPSSVATVFDGYPMAQKGEAGKALGAATISSFIGGIFSAIVLALLAPPIAIFALRFSAPEYFSLAFFGLTVIASISGGALIKGIISGAIGVLISLVGTDPMVGFPRFTFGQMSLLPGISLLPAMIGLFAVSQGLLDSEKIIYGYIEPIQTKIKGILPGLSEVISNWKVLLQSAIIGSSIGIIPGAGGSIASLVAYDQAKKRSKTPEKFGTGHIEGVIASETANNAKTGGALVPMLTLGIPGDTATAILMGALVLQGLRPGPVLFDEQPAIAYGIFMAFFFANIFMFIFKYLGIPLFAKVLQVPKEYLTPLILVFGILGAYGASLNIFDAYLAIGFGVLGYFLMKYDFGLAPVILGIILGRLAESNLRRSLLLSQGDWSVFITRPISLFFLILAAISLVGALIKEYKTFKSKISKAENVV